MSFDFPLTRWMYPSTNTSSLNDQFEIQFVGLIIPFKIIEFQRKYLNHKNKIMSIFLRIKGSLYMHLN